MNALDNALDRPIAESLATRCVVDHPWSAELEDQFWAYGAHFQPNLGGRPGFEGTTVDGVWGHLPHGDADMSWATDAAAAMRAAGCYVSDVSAWDESRVGEWIARYWGSLRANRAGYAQGCLYPHARIGPPSPADADRAIEHERAIAKLERAIARLAKEGAPPEALAQARAMGAAVCAAVDQRRQS